MSGLLLQFGAGMLAGGIGALIAGVRQRGRATAALREAQRIALIAGLQARVLAECRDLLCDDCRTIVHGHYMRHAYGFVTAFLEGQE